MSDIGEIRTKKPQGYQTSGGACKGICTRYRARKPIGMGRYAAGQKRCQLCEIFIECEGLRCPCCNYRLRTKPRNLKYKEKFRAKVEAESKEAKL